MEKFTFKKEEEPWFGEYYSISKDGWDDFARVVVPHHLSDEYRGDDSMPDPEEDPRYLTNLMCHAPLLLEELRDARSALIDAGYQLDSSTIVRISKAIMKSDGLL